MSSGFVSAFSGLRTGATVWQPTHDNELGGWKLAGVIVEVTPKDVSRGRRFLTVSLGGVSELRDITAATGRLGLDVDVGRAEDASSLIHAMDMNEWRPGKLDDPTARMVEQLIGHLVGRGLPPGGPAVVHFNGDCIDCRHPWHSTLCPFCNCGS
jgi:hypothetical protein